MTDEELQNIVQKEIAVLGFPKPADYEPSDYYVDEAKRRLYELPAVCEHQNGNLLDKIEISAMRAALARIADDPFYPIIPAVYFQRMGFKETAMILTYTKATIIGQHRRIIKKLAFILYGVRSWKKWEHC